MMVFKFFSKIKYRCLIGLLGCIALFMTGCGTADEAIVLIPVSYTHLTLPTA